MAFNYYVRAEGEGDPVKCERMRTGGRGLMNSCQCDCFPINFESLIQIFKKEKEYDNKQNKNEQK